MTGVPLRREILAAVYDRHADILYRIALAQLGCREDAEDAVQDVFSKLLQNAPNFTDEEHERAWLIRVTVNRCHDLQRRRKHRNHVSLDDALEVPDSDCTEHGDEVSHIMELISSLPEKYRSAVVLHYLEDMSVDTAARSLGISESAMKMRLMRAREMLQKLIARK